MTRPLYIKPKSTLRQRAARLVLPPILYKLARRGLPKLVGRLMRPVVELEAGARTGTWRALALPKPGFTEDALAVFGDDPRFSLWTLNRHFVKAVYPNFLPPWVDDNGYLLAGPALDPAKAALRAFWMEAWPVLQQSARADVVVTGNFGYHAEQEFGTAVEASGVPLIAMHKEALKTPGFVGFFEDLYRNRRQPFKGRRVLVYNNIERGIQIASGIITPDRVTICGMPRLDRAHRWRRAAAAGQVPAGDGRPRILFFSFHPKTGLPTIPRKKGSLPEGRRTETLGAGLDELTWEKVCNGCHQVLFEIARENPDIDVVVKGKGGLLKWLERTGGPKLEAQGLPNLRLLVGGDPQELIGEATVVSGFITTALLEALASGRRVVVPRFEEVKLPTHSPYFLDLGAAVEHAQSQDEFKRLLVQAARNAVTPHAMLSDQVATMLDYWAGNADGEASRRVATAVAAEIDRPKRISRAA